MWEKNALGNKEAIIQTLSTSRGRALIFMSPYYFLGFFSLSINNY